MHGYSEQKDNYNTLEASTRERGEFDMLLSGITNNM